MFVAILFDRYTTGSISLWKRQNELLIFDIKKYLVNSVNFFMTRKITKENAMHQSTLKYGHFCIWDNLNIEQVFN